MKRFASCLTLCFLFLMSRGEGAQAGKLTLESYLQEVEAANPSLSASRSRARALEERVLPAGAWDDPFFAAGPDEIQFGGGMGSVTRFQLSQAIPFPGKLGAREDAARARADSARLDAETDLRSVTVLATQSFFRGLFIRRALVLNAEIQRLIQGTVDSTKARYRAGDPTHHDWLLARAEVAILAVERLRLTRESQALDAFMNELRNRPVTATLDLAEPAFSFAEEVRDAEELIATQPEMRGIRLNLQAVEAEERFAVLSYFPDLLVQGMVMKAGHEEGMSSWGVMVGINLPIFFYRKQSNLLRAARLDRETSLAEQLGLENRLKTEVRDAGLQLKSAREVVGLYRREVMPATEAAVANARSGYAARKLPLSQLLETLRVQRTQGLELYAALIDFELAQVRVRELLSAPPILRLAPSRPTLFGAGMSEGMSGMVRMGEGMSGPNRKDSRTGPRTQNSGGSGMSGMGGM